MNTAAAVAILGLVLNPLISLVKQQQFPRAVNALIALAFAGVGGLLAVALGAGFPDLRDPANWAATAASVYAASQIVYHLLFHDSPLDQALTAFPATRQSAGRAPDQPPIKKGRG